jgi:hypothetical protein
MAHLELFNEYAIAESYVAPIIYNSKMDLEGNEEMWVNQFTTQVIASVAEHYAITYSEARKRIYLDVKDDAHFRRCDVCKLMAHAVTLNVLVEII